MGVRGGSQVKKNSNVHNQFSPFCASPRAARVVQLALAITRSCCWCAESLWCKT